MDEVTDELISTSPQMGLEAADEKRVGQETLML